MVSRKGKRQPSWGGGCQHTILPNFPKKKILGHRGIGGACRVHGTFSSQVFIRTDRDKSFWGKNRKILAE